MSAGEVNLASIFQSVTQSLAENQQALDQADGINQDHGSNMVQTFQTITDALQKKKSSSASAALNYAAKQLSQSSTSGSGQLYAQNLSQAAAQFKGKKIDAGGALQLLQTLIGGQAGPSSDQTGGGDLLGSLLGGLAGGGASSQPTPQAGGGDLMSMLLGGMAGGAGQQPDQQSYDQAEPSAAGGNLLGSLLGGLAGGGDSSQQPSQAGGGDLMSMLLGGLGGGAGQPSAPSGGGDLIGSLLGSLVSGGGLQSLVQTFLGGSGMGDSAHRTQSTQVVVNSFLQALGSSGNRP